MSCDRRGAAADAAELLYPRSSRHRAKEREVSKRIPGKETEREREGGDKDNTSSRRKGKGVHAQNQTKTVL